MKKIIISIVSVIFVLTISGCGEETTTNEKENSQTSKTTNEQNMNNQQKTEENTVTASKITCDDSTMQTKCPVDGDKIAIIVTNMGVIKFKLFEKQVPETSKNFEELAKTGKYNGVIFHRVIKDFMIQTGDFENNNGTGGYSYKGPGTTIKDEINPALKHLYGTVSMAKTSAPNSGGSQFFIVENKNGTSYLDGVHSVFGQVYYGMDIVKKIEAAPTGAMDKPTTKIFMEKVIITTYGSADDKKYL
jgi:cyclophilin family peptidyl-prolyl cis-trans isomerase